MKNLTTNERRQFVFAVLTAFVFLFVAQSAAMAQQVYNEYRNKETAGTVIGNVVGTWYYTTIINADGTEKKLSNRESYLWLKEDGSYEHRFGNFGQIGTFAASASRLTLNREDGDKKVYTMTIAGTTMTLKNDSGGYKLERQ
jgi:hypothetical protein